MLRQWRNQAARVSGHVGHLGAGRDFAEAFVQSLREPEAPFDQRLAQHFCLPGKRQGMPCDVAAPNGLFHAFAVGRGRLLEVLVEQPRPGGPHVAALAPGVGRAGYVNGAGKIFREVTVHNIRLGVDESRVEVALEHHQDAFNLRIRLNRIRFNLVCP